MQYQPPVNDIKFVLFDVLGLDQLQSLEKYEEATPDIISGVIDEAGKLAAQVLQPVNRIGDEQGCTYHPATHAVTTPDGFIDAYRQFIEAGWASLDAPIEYGEHDLVDNIIHLVLVKLPDAPHGTKRISLFIVPKVLPDNGERIYEGTNGIQAMDLVGRKLGLKGGRLITQLFDTIGSFLTATPDAPHHSDLVAALESLEEATSWIAANGIQDPEQAGAAASPYLRLMALTVIAYLWSRMAGVARHQLAEGEGNRTLLEGKLICARYYFEKLLPESGWLLADITSGKDSMMEFTVDHWKV